MTDKTDKNVNNFYAHYHPDFSEFDDEPETGADAGPVKCRKCGNDPIQASAHAAYLQRASPKGKFPVIWECSPSCEHRQGGPDAALLNAIEEA